MKLFNKHLENLGLNALQAASKPIIASLISEKPILFVSDNTIAILTLAQKLFMSRYDVETEQQQGLAIYDAKKVREQDIFSLTGEIDSNQNKATESDQTKSIQDQSFIVIDDLAKSKKSMKATWTKILLSEEVENQTTSNLRNIFARTGEIKFKNKNTLDHEQANAFGLIVPVPSAGSIDFLSNMSMVSVIHWGADPQNRIDLKKLTMDVKNIHQALSVEHKTLISEFVSAFSRELDLRELEFSKAQQASLAENIELFFSIDLYEGDLTASQIEQNLLLATQYSWTPFVTNTNPKLKALKKSYYEASIGLNETAKISKRHFKELKQQYAKEDMFDDYLSDDDDEPGSMAEDVSGLVQALGAGLELFTVGFYEMVVKGNSDWKSKMKINN